jgi:hypothetical protein
MNQIYRGYGEHNKPTPLERFVLDRAKDRVSARTINYALSILNIIGNKAVRRWRGASGKPLIPFWNCVPLVDQEEGNALGLKAKRTVGPISWEEQILLFNELPEFNRDMCLFKVNNDGNFLKLPIRIPPHILVTKYSSRHPQLPKVTISITYKTSK